MVTRELWQQICVIYSVPDSAIIPLRWPGRNGKICVRIGVKTTERSSSCVTTPTTRLTWLTWTMLQRFSPWYTPPIGSNVWIETSGGLQECVQLCLARNQYWHSWAVSQWNTRLLTGCYPTQPATRLCFLTNGIGFLSRKAYLKAKKESPPWRLPDSSCYQYRRSHIADGLLLSRARFLVRLQHKIDFFDMKYKIVY